MTNPLVVGVDVHRQNNAIAIMNSQGNEVTPRFRVANNLPGTQEFAHQVAQLMTAGDFDTLVIAAEATGWYWFHFFQTLSQESVLQPWPLTLHPFNPRVTAGFKQAYIDLDKTDPSDAAVVADRLRFGRDLPAPWRLDETYLPLRFLTRYRHHLVHQLAREKAYCLAILYLKASEYNLPQEDRRPFSNIFGATSRAVLQEFASLEEIAALPFEELVEFIDRHGKRRFADPATNARKLLRVVAESYRVPEVLQQPIQAVLDWSLQQISFLERQVKRVDTAIAARMATIPQPLETIPGIGPVFAGGILAEIGGAARFHYQEHKVAKFAGFKWRKTKSADFEADETRLTRTGNRYLRYYFCEAANAVRMRDREYAAYYDRKYHEVRTHQHKRAIVLTARKLVRLVVALLNTNQPYRARRN